ncbi:hypothetical protein [Oenococcus oeni]|uniref:hypothetical protein n=1 Tax=Oenococcus oeni TaxID=1247 RepID=UPI0010B25973|nr:hypothetical protein [Oenococcus oeni]SYW14947.1 hypothetical protein OENI_80017 [Oenococcus oeni]
MGGRRSEITTGNVDSFALSEDALNFFNKIENSKNLMLNQGSYVSPEIKLDLGSLKTKTN